MKLSVLMSVYAKETPGFLRESLKSLAIQTRPADEVVLVEDGLLSDVLYAVLAEFREVLPIVPLRLSANVGLGEALRQGLDICRGEFVARMDTDDVSLSRRLEKQLAFLEANPEVDVTGTAIAEFDNDSNKPYAVRRLPSSNAELARFARWRNPLNHMSVMFRRSAVLSAGNYRPWIGFEDYHLWTRMLMAGSALHNLDEVLVHVRCGNGMQTRRGGVRYVWHEARMQLELHRLGFLNLFECLRNIGLRTPVRLLPAPLRALLYQFTLRHKPSRKDATSSVPA
ncbi:MAG TPA: glycosyltransferase [Terracidiphilus sp.]|nr:glycosyltransferase [Terracidiphilus sp.]